MTDHPSSQERTTSSSTSRLISRHERLLGIAETADGPQRADATDKCDELLLLHRLEEMRQSGMRPDAKTREAEGKLCGRFQIVRELGRGGQGIVYLAHDPALNRDVALKIPRLEAIGSESLRKRFLREATAAAQLDHPALVPVYEVGEVGPACYLVMAYCKGPTLATWLADRPGLPPVQVAANLAFTLAGALAHVHRHGIVHRDVKPGNILLEPVVDETVDNGFPFLPLLSDFGLARLGPASEISVQGNLFGTLDYMAPEQLSADASELGPQTDLYALGCVLYELLTGHVPYPSKNSVDAMRKISDGAIPPPRNGRSGIPRDLEAICLKCLAREPRDRYKTAADLQTDLKRFLSARPVRVRPVGAAGRVIRWTRRQPVVATLIGLMLITVFVGALGIVWNWKRAQWNSQLAQIRTNELAEQREESRDAIRQFHRVAGELDPAENQRERDLRRSVLEASVEHYHRLLLHTGQHPLLSADIADALSSLAEIEYREGNTTDAVRLMSSAWARLKRSAEEMAYCPERIQIPLADLELRLGELFVVQNKPAEAMPHLKNALRRHRTLHDAEGMAADLRALATASKQEHRLEEAFRYQQRAVSELNSSLGDVDPYRSSFRFQRAEGLYKMAQLEWNNGDESNAIAHCESAMREFHTVASSTGNPDAMHGVGICRHLLAAMHRQAGRYERALSNYALAEETFAPLVQDFPNVDTFRWALAANHFNRARTHRAMGESSKAHGWLARARDTYQKLTRDHPEEPHFRTEFGRVTWEVADIHREGGEPLKAVRVLDEAAAVIASCGSSTIRHRKLRRKIARSYQDLADAFRVCGRESLFRKCQTRHSVLSRDSTTEASDPG